MQKVHLSTGSLEKEGNESTVWYEHLSMNESTKKDILK